MINKKRNRRGWKILVVWVIWFLTGCAELPVKGVAEEKNRLEEKRVAAVDPAVAVPPLFFSPDGQHAVWINRTGGQFQVVLDGVAGPPFDNIAKGPVVLSPDGRRLAYLVENKESGHLSVVVDGTAGPEYEKILSGTPMFSPDGRRIAYGAVLQEKYRVILDGVAGPDYELIGHLTFSGDSRRFAYAAQKEGKRFIVLDEVPGPPFEDVFISGFSPDHRHLVYYSTEKKKKRVLVDGRPGSEFDTIGPVRFHFERKNGPGRISYLGLRGEEIIQVTQELD